MTDLDTLLAVRRTPVRAALDTIPEQEPRRERDVVTALQRASWLIGAALCEIGRGTPEHLDLVDAENAIEAAIKAIRKRESDTDHGDVGASR